MENHTGTHKESTDLMQKRRASLGKRRTETQMHYDFYGPRLWCLGSHVTLRGRPRSFFPLRSSAPARQIYRRGQTEHPKGLPCEARENAPGSSVSQSKISETKLMKESLLISQAIAAPILPIYFIGGKCPGLLIHTQSSFGQIFSSNDLTCLLGSIIHHFSLEKVNNLTCMTKAPPPRGFSGYRKFLEMLMRNEVACRPIDRRRKRGQVLWVQRRRCSAFRHPERRKTSYVKEIVSYVTSCFPLRGKCRRQWGHASGIACHVE